MPLFALLVAVAVVAGEYLIESRYGIFGTVGVVLLAVGVKAGNHTCSCLGAAVLTVLVMGP